MGRPELADDVAFWRLVHYAATAAQAGGPGKQQQMDLGDMIVRGQSDGQRLGRKVLRFKCESHAWERGRVHPRNPFF